ncbi:E3 binding domain-containing protein [Candidatus Liberibacter africanus]|nr:E3 binding domain-containing protein [Candidatus Liberibacter africanus]
MATKIILPSLGESVSEATVGQWIKEVGDFVKIGETLVSLETDKVTIEVPSPVSGKLKEVSFSAGEIVTPGAFLGYIEEVEDHDFSQKKDAPVTVCDTSENFQMPHSPSASKLIAEHDLSPADIKGTGKRGQILKSDVMEAIAHSGSSTDKSKIDSGKKVFFLGFLAVPLIVLKNLVLPKGCLKSVSKCLVYVILFLNA